MDQKLINQLNKLNRDFYSKTSKFFDESRQKPWEGWKQLIEKENELPAYVIPSAGRRVTGYGLRETGNRKLETVLDIGCGNGRFGEFLLRHFPNADYTGIDFSPELLKFAEEKFKSKKLSGKFIHSDILDTKWAGGLKKKFDLITLFGVIHHIAGFENRKRLIKNISELLNRKGQLVITVWQFKKFERFDKKTLDKDFIKNELGINANKLEENDFILDWKRGTKAYRFAHYVDDSEMIKLVSDTNLKLMYTYDSDGKTNNLNKYYIFSNG